MNTPYPSRWAELFDVAMAIIDHANAQGIGMDRWSFGGGTALMLQIGHRESHDIDLFIDDAQYLPWLNPQIQGYALDLAPSDYETDGTRALKITFDGIGEVDFICCDPVSPVPFTETTVRGRNLRLETPGEILAKKIVFRGKHLQPRDMFDIAACALALGKDRVIEALRQFPEACSDALKVTRAMDPGLVGSVVSRLMVAADFRPLQSSAQVMAEDILAACLAVGP